MSKNTRTQKTPLTDILIQFHRFPTYSHRNKSLSVLNNENGKCLNKEQEWMEITLGMEGAEQF